MNAEQWSKAKSLLAEALAQSPSRREAFLLGACDDPALAEEILSLLRHSSDIVEGAAVCRSNANVPALSAGTRLGPYEIEALIGVGGMGIVYKAKDRRLGRSVALKVLPAADETSRNRFKREADAIAALNHPHICTLYDVGTDQGVDYLALEYLEGQTLKDRLAEGPLSIDDILDIAVDIAAAMDSAHRAGLVHRDLNPRNIMLTKTGPKLLDFGLVRVIESAGPPVGTLTIPGAVLGTPSYMAPEQLDGRDADYRADLWAFGCVVHEMITGAPPFRGSSHATLVAAILERQPAQTSVVRTDVPPLLEHLVGQCLVKDRDLRWQAASDIRVELEWIRAQRRTRSEHGGSGPVAHAAAIDGSTRRFGRRLAWAAAVAVGTLAGLTIGIRFSGTGRNSASAIRLTIDPPAGAVFHPPSIGVSPALTNAPFPAVSPNGATVAFVTALGSEPNRIWLRDVNSFYPRALAGTEDASYPFWSPDSAWIGFFADNKIKKVPVAGGPAVTLYDAGFITVGGGAWGADAIVLSARFPKGTGLWRMAPTGGEPSLLPIPRNGRTPQLYPAFLPDGRHFLFSQWDGIYVAALDGSSIAPVIPVLSKAIYSPPGYLLFLRNGSLFAQPFDSERLRLTGSAGLVAERIPDYYGAAPFSASATGVLVYREGLAPSDQLIWIDRSGNRLSTIGSPSLYKNPSLSPDGRWLAVSRFDRSWDIWIIDLARGVESRLTSDPGTESDPVWSPDSSELLFQSDRAGATQIYRKPANGATSESLFLPASSEAAPDLPSLSMTPTGWSRDGRTVIFSDHGDLWSVRLGDQNQRVRLMRTPSAEENGQLSPDGRWLAYESDESGDWEIYVRPFPNVSERRWQISAHGGRQPRWRADGKELFYVAAQRQFMSAPVTPGAEFSFDEPRLLFEAVMSDALWGYAVTPDGSRFLVDMVDESHASQPTPLSVVVNWVTAIK